MLWWHRFTKFDRILLGVATITLTLSFILIVNDAWLFRLYSTDTGNLESIGQLKISVNDVRRRHGSAFSWLPIGKSNEVYQGDSIFTGDKSEAIILTDKGEQISISPNSLVVINAKQDSIRLDINYGSVLGQLGKNKKLLVASSSGEITEFSGEDAVVKVDVASGKNLVVNVITGQVEVTSDGEKKLIGPNQEARIGKKGAILQPGDARIDLQTPAPDRLIQPDERGDLMLTWSSSYSFPDYKIELALDPNFKHIIYKDRSARPAIKPPNLPVNEKIYWRVSAALTPKESPTRSAFSTFTVVEDLPSKLSFPSDQMRLTFESTSRGSGQGINVVMVWKPLAAARQWEVQLSSRPEFEGEFKTLKTPNSFVDSGPLDPGSYYWRVRSLDWPKATWSETYNFRIVRVAPTTHLAPQALVESDQFFLVTRLGDFTTEELANANGESMPGYLEALPLLKWEDVPGAVGYQIEISRQPTFESIAIKENLSEASFTWRSVLPGQFYWRIRSLNASNSFGPFSRPQPLKISLAPPRPIIPEKFEEGVDDLRAMETAPAPFALAWSPTLFTYGYELEFDRDPQFAKPLKAHTKNSYKKVQAPSAGTYYWRVRSLDSKGYAVSEFSPPIQLIYEKKYLSPESSRELRALYPGENDSLVVVGKGQIEINFRWIRPISHGKYRVQLSEREDFSELGLDVLTRLDFHPYRGSLKAGWYHWRIRVETDKFTSPWTKPFRFQIRREDTPFDFATSEHRLAEAQKTKKGQDHLLSADQPDKAKAAKPTSHHLSVTTQLEGPDEFHIIFRPRNLSDLKNWHKLPSSTWPQLMVQQPQLSWLPVEGARNYRVEFSTNPDFKSLSMVYKVNNPPFAWAPLNPGQFYWRVVPELGPNTPADASAPKAIRIVFSPPKTTAPHSTLTKETGAKASVSLTWLPVLGAKTYEVEWAPLDGSMPPVKATTGHREHVLYLENHTKIKWRVRPMGQDNQAITKPSAWRTMTVGRASRTPANQEKIDLRFPDNSLSIPVEKDSDATLDFFWTAQIKRGTFILELSRQADFSTRLRQKELDRTAARLTLPSEAGPIYWRVSQLIRGKIVHQSKVGSFHVEKIDLREPTGQK